MLNYSGIFPEPDKDRVIQIANMVSTYGKTEPFIRNVMTLDTCAPIVGSEVMSHKLEEDLLDVILPTFGRYLTHKKLWQWK